MNKNNNIKLQDIGMRPTKLRQAILKVLSSTPEPLSVPDILIKLKSGKLNPNKTSLYRAFETMKKEGFINEIMLGENKKRYELADKSHHHHIVCESCGSIEDIEMEKDLDLFEKKIEKTKNFKIASHSLEFFGLCQKCA